jgi:putative ABC transport system permease protein
MGPWRRRSDDDFADEIRANIEIETDRLIANGIRSEEARATARRTFGSAARAQERFYESRRIMWLDDLRRDVWYALRTLARNPVFAAVAIATLGVGIGAGTVVYTFARAVLFRPLPYTRPNELVRIFETNPLRNWTRSVVAPANYADWKTRNAAFTDIAAYQAPLAINLDDEVAERFSSGAVRRGGERMMDELSQRRLR